MVLWIEPQTHDLKLQIRIKFLRTERDKIFDVFFLPGF